jgi:hypothetical protein
VFVHPPDGVHFSGQEMILAVAGTEESVIGNRGMSMASEGQRYEHWMGIVSGAVSGSGTPCGSPRGVPVRHPFAPCPPKLIKPGHAREPHGT